MKKLIQKTRGRKESTTSLPSEGEKSSKSHLTNALKTLSPFQFGKSKKGGKFGSQEELQYDYDINKDPNFTKLHKACFRGETLKVNQLIKKQDVNCLDARKRSPLHIASAEGHKEIVQTLITSQADVNAQDFDGNTALICAVQHSHIVVVKVLLENGADVLKVDACGNTALHISLLLGQSDVTLSLLDWYKNVDIQNLEGISPLQLAATQKQHSLVKKLIEKGADVNSTDKEGRTPIMLACASGILPSVGILLEHGADPSRRDKNGRTCLDYTTLSDHREEIEMLIQENKNRPLGVNDEALIPAEIKALKDDDSWNDSADGSVCEQISVARLDNMAVGLDAARGPHETIDSTFYEPVESSAAHDLSVRIADQLSSRTSVIPRDLFEEFGLSDVSESISTNNSLKDSNHEQTPRDKKKEQEDETDVEEDPLSSLGYVPSIATLSPGRKQSSASSCQEVSGRKESANESSQKSTPTRPPRKSRTKGDQSKPPLNENEGSDLTKQHTDSKIEVKLSSVIPGVSKKDFDANENAKAKGDHLSENTPDLENYKFRFGAKLSKSDSDSDWSQDSSDSLGLLKKKPPLDLESTTLEQINSSPTKLSSSLAVIIAKPENTLSNVEHVSGSNPIIGNEFTMPLESITKGSEEFLVNDKELLESVIEVESSKHDFDSNSVTVNEEVTLERQLIEPVIQNSQKEFYSVVAKNETATRKDVDMKSPFDVVEKIRESTTNDNCEIAVSIFPILMADETQKTILPGVENCANKVKIGEGPDESKLEKAALVFHSSHKQEINTAVHWQFGDSSAQSHLEQNSGIASLNSSQPIINHVPSGNNHGEALQVLASVIPSLQSPDVPEALSLHDRRKGEPFDSKEGTLGRFSTLQGVEEIWEQNSSFLLPKMANDSDMSFSPRLDTESSTTFTESDNDDSRMKENSELDASSHSSSSESFSLADVPQVTPAMLSSPSRLSEIQALLSHHKVAVEKEKCKISSMKAIVKALTREKKSLTKLVFLIIKANVIVIKMR